MNIDFKRNMQRQIFGFKEIRSAHGPVSGFGQLDNGT
jgi:hypothetical protein